MAPEIPPHLPLRKGGYDIPPLIKGGWGGIFLRRPLQTQIEKYITELMKYSTKLSIGSYKK